MVHEEEGLVAAVQNEPAWRTVLFAMSAERRDRVRRFTDRGSFGDRTARPDSLQKCNEVGREHRLGGGIGLLAF